ncbi:MAG TPA: response regulator transcription factor [Elusimicrobiota bacterium]|nr:response regulator transcription factor [Elusimicrobiota bacterium]
MKEKILVVEDEKDLVRLIKHNLEKEGYSVLSAGTAEAGLKSARASKPGLIILDIMLPGIDGLEFLRLLRRESRTPVILLSAKRSETDRILGLKLGADDYVVKPFSHGELMARVEARLRPPEAPANGSAACIGGMSIDAERHEVTVKGKPVRLAPKEFALLRLLVEADGKVLSRDRLLELIWGHDKSMEIDTRTVDQHVARLRRKLGPEGSRIATVPNFGYQVRR